MEPTPKQQAVDLIKRAQRILVVPGRPDGDSIGSALACLMVLTKINKEVSVALLEPVSQQFRFLPRVTDIARDINGARDFIITLDNPAVETDKLSYNFDDGKLNIVITPKRGRYQPENVTFQQGAFKYDLILTLDSPHLGMLGGIYDRYPTLFQGVPMINIDHHASNAHFGAVNLVDLAATSTAEILIGVIESLGADLIDGDVATALLTGIIADTGSFQNANTTPKSLTIAAQMVGLGARQQEIVRQLFKTKSLAMLKLWGQILSNIQFDTDHKLVWGTAGLDDLSSTGATEHDFSGLIDELMTSVPGADIVMLLSERKPKVISGSVRTVKGVDAAAVCQMFGGGGHPGAAGFQILDVTLGEALPVVLEKLRAYQGKRLGLPGVTPQEKVASGE
jgi:phosphoesterase RecJ-like protein